MNNFAVPPLQTRTAVARARADQSRQTELMLYALGCGLTLLLSSMAVVLSITQIA